MYLRSILCSIITVSVTVSVFVLLSSFEYEETVTVITTGPDIEKTTTETPQEIVSTFTVPLESGNYLECTKTKSIDCITPGSRKLVTHKRHRSKNGVSGETSIIVSVKKKYNQPIIYYNYPSSSKIPKPVLSSPGKQFQILWHVSISAIQLHHYQTI